MSGFPWLFLAHALYRQSWLIQISDLTGAYGVSFIAALVNGVLVALVLRYWKPPETRTRRQVWVGLGATLVVLIATLAYGHHRTSQQDFATGPRVAVIQDDFPLVSTPPYGERPHVIFARYVRLAADAAATRPDLLAFPETVWSATQNIGFLSVERNAVDDVSVGAWQYGKLCHEAIAAFARGEYDAVNHTLREFEQRYGGPLPRLPAGSGPPVTVVLGATSIETFPEATYPKTKRYNSALIYDPDGTQRPRRYDKTHLVPFGESVPFRYGRLHWLYRWLNKLSPFSYGGSFEYSLSPGRDLTRFELTTADGTTHFGTPICYEDVMPYVVRRYVWDGQRRVDFLVNISNDGWFVYGNELPQHLAICVFRAVENRIAIAARGQHRNQRLHRPERARLFRRRNRGTSARPWHDRLSRRRRTTGSARQLLRPRGGLVGPAMPAADRRPVVGGRHGKMGAGDADAHCHVASQRRAQRCVDRRVSASVISPLARSGSSACGRYCCCCAPARTPPSQ